MNFKYLYILLVFISSLSGTAGELQDTIRVYQLGDIDISGKSYEKSILKSSIQTLDYYTIKTSDVNTVSELQLYIPAARISTNSRGESLLYLRGAGERQLGVFFDGVPLNVAWDNRFDLSLLPVDIIGKLEVNKNGNSIMFGPNVLGGALNINTYERAAEGFGGNVRLQAGEAGMYQAGFTQDGKIDRLNYIASVGYMKTNGFILSANRPDTLLNQNLNSSLRTNSDKEFLSLYGRAEYEFNETDKIGLSVLNINGEKGVSPEGDLPEEDARLWRYPEWNRTLFSANGKKMISKSINLVLRGTAWYDLFNQTINSYNDISYTSVKDSQTDKDNTIGTRLLLDWNINPLNRLSYVFNWYYTEHDEAITNYNPDNTFETSSNLYAQNVISTGLEYEYFYHNFSARGGALYDFSQTSEAGVFTSEEGNTISDFGFYVSFQFNPWEKTILFANSSYRTRFPTMRESYSGALGKFKVNPDLKPESGLLNEIGIKYSEGIWQAEAAVFVNLYNDLIEQIRLSSEADSLRRRMRVNISDAIIYGLDLTFRIFPVSNFSLEGNFTYMLSEGKQGEIDIEHLDNKPQILTGFIAKYTFDFGLKLQAEAETVGIQYQRDPNANESFIRIDGTTIFNARIAYRLPIFMGTITEAFLRINNIADTYRIYQLGLPEPGRMLSAGLSLNF